MKRFLVYLVAGLLLCSVPVFAQHATMTYPDMPTDIKYFDVAFSNYYNGLTNVYYASGNTKWLSGYMDRVIVHSMISSGATVTVYLKDDKGVDLLAGLGVGLATSTITHCFYPAIRMNDGVGITNLAPFCFSSALSFSATNFADPNPTTNYCGSVRVFYVPSK